MAFCGECGKKIEDWVKFCPFCGTPNVVSQRSESEDVIKNGTINNNAAGGYGTPVEQTQGTIDSRGGGYGLALSNLPKDHELENGRYRIEKKLGRGGFGTVYKAWDGNTDSWKALKIIDDTFYDDKRVIADLKREAKLLMKLNSPFVVRIWDIHLHGEIKFIDMEYVDGGDLEDLLLSYPDHKVPEEKVMELLKAISLGMTDIHNHNIIHKDLKPQNIMVPQSGDIKIMDFGISETFRSSKSRMKESSKSGTPAYMSPEQLLGKDVGREADIWSVGVMLYELISGKQMFTGTTTNEVYFQIEHREFEPITGIPDKLNNLLKRSLKMNFRERFTSFQELIEFLEKSYLPQKIGNMIYVKGGSFMMGSDDKYVLSNEKPVHQVALDSFYISKYQLTFAEYDEYCEATGCEKPDDEDWGRDYRPVINVSWYGAIKYCNWRSIQEDLTPCYYLFGNIKIWDNEKDYLHQKCAEIKFNHSANGYRLPTEAEWEYAARGGHKSVILSGSERYKYSGSNTADRVAWCIDDSNNKTHPVGTKQPNELGLFDMSGNVYEWCWDLYGNYKSSIKTNPAGEASGSCRVFRGGSWYYGATHCLVAFRSRYYPSLSSSYRGFRLLRSSK